MNWDKLIKKSTSLEIEKEMVKEQTRDIEDQFEVLKRQGELNEQHRKAIKRLRR